jgi:hypothetical protein
VIMHGRPMSDKQRSLSPGASVAVFSMSREIAGVRIG